MPTIVTMDQGLAAAEKIQGRLLKLGRGQYEAARDAERWVFDTWGLNVSLGVQAPPPPSPSWTVISCYGRQAGCWCRRCQWVERTQRARATKRSRAGKKAAATKKYGKAYREFQAGNLSRSDLYDAQQEWTRRCCDIDYGLFD